LDKQYFLTRIGIRSEDLEDFLERTIKGSGISLSSPRLVIPATIYGLWILFHQYFTNDIFDFQVILGSMHIKKCFLEPPRFLVWINFFISTYRRRK